MRKNQAFKISHLLSDFAGFNLFAVIILLSGRVLQYFYLGAAHTLPAHAKILELQGFVQDAWVWLLAGFLLLIPFLILAYLRRWIGLTFLALSFLIYAAAEWVLFQHFIITLVPLDQVIFSYSWTEMILIARSSAGISFSTWFPLLVIVALCPCVIALTVKIKIPPFIVVLFFIVALIAIPLGYMFGLKESGFTNRFEYHVTLNKSYWFLDHTLRYKFKSKTDADLRKTEAAAMSWQQSHPEFEYTGTGYPFLHTEKTRDVLGPFFNLQKEPPNLVFIIVESLSPCFMGNNPIYGSFTPFLDSLAGKSLFWNNFLATSDRTFNVLPAMFGSLPPGDPTFIGEASRMPSHLTLIQLLRENGYFTGFYYGGDPAFNFMEDFIKRQGTHYILKYFGPRFKKENMINDGYSWGYSDEDLFSRSLEAIDSANRSPRLDIYLTLSLHSPFIPPRSEYYLARVEERLRHIPPDFWNRRDLVKYRNIFSTVLYTDDALRKFFNRYRKRSDYQNTIFVITGDHGLPELNLYRFSGMAHYNVPLLIYSPMLKKPDFFRSVSSHLDITPTFLSLLASRYHLKTRPYSAWLGTGIDTAVNFRNTHSVPFILNNKEILEYLEGDYFLYQQRLFRLKPEFWNRDTNVPVICQKMMKDLADFKILNTYVTKQNRLIPQELFFQQKISGLFLKNQDSVRFNPGDTLGEFRQLYQDLKVDPDIKMIELDITLELATSETDPDKAPLVVTDLCNPDGKQLLWHATKLPCREQGSSKEPQSWKSLRIRDRIDVSYLHRDSKCLLKSYIWNKTLCKVRFNRAVITLTGYY